MYCGIKAAPTGQSVNLFAKSKMHGEHQENAPLISSSSHSSHLQILNLQKNKELLLT